MYFLQKTIKIKHSYWSIYLSSFEVLFRMTSGLIFYESIKYWVVVLLFVGFIVEKRKKRTHLFFFYLLVFINYFHYLHKNTIRY